MPGRLPEWKEFLATILASADADGMVARGSGLPGFDGSHLLHLLPPAPESAGAPEGLGAGPRAESAAPAPESAGAPEGLGPGHRAESAAPQPAESPAPEPAESAAVTAPPLAESTPDVPDAQPPMAEADVPERVEDEMSEGAPAEVRLAPSRTTPAEARQQPEGAPGLPSSGC